MITCSVTRRFTFEAAHAISNYNGACKHLHGHSYKLEVSVSGTTTEESAMLIDFKILKHIVQEYVLNDYDHALILKLNDLNLQRAHHPSTKILWLNDEPTAEYMLTDISKRIKPHLPPKVQLSKLVLHETENCYVTFNFNEHEA